MVSAGPRPPAEWRSLQGTTDESGGRHLRRVPHQVLGAGGTSRPVLVLSVCMGLLGT